MIYEKALTPAQKAKSQFNFNMYNAVNGFSYMCLGETVLILLAVRLNSPDYVVSTLGAMVYLGFLLLPLGKFMTAKVGAARSQALFWIYRNVAALVVASSTVLVYCQLPRLAIGTLLVGAFFFYGFRAAGVIMSQPLLGDITDDSSRSRVISVSWGLFNLFCLISLVTISVLMKLNSSIWMLTGIIVFGAALGIFASTFIRKIDETAELRRSAAKSIKPDWHFAWSNRDFRRLLLAEFTVNVAVILVAPVSILTLKRGYGMSDAGALVFALVQFGSSAVVAFVSAKLIEWFGSRRMLIISFGEMLLCAMLWLMAPGTLKWWFAGIIFFLIGAAAVNILNCAACYFLQIIPPRYRVSTSIFRSVLTGAGAGIIGMLLSGGLLKLSAKLTTGNLTIYRYYFGGAVVLLTLGLWAVARLRALPREEAKTFWRVRRRRMRLQ